MSRKEICLTSQRFTQSQNDRSRPRYSSPESQYKQLHLCPLEEGARQEWGSLDRNTTFHQPASLLLQVGMWNLMKRCNQSTGAKLHPLPKERLCLGLHGVGLGEGQTQGL